MEMSVTFSSTYYPCTPALYRTTIHCTIIEYIPYVDTNAKVTNFLPCCTIGISICQESILPYDTLFPTYLPQAYSPFEHYWQTEKILHPLLHKFFFSLSALGPTRRHNSTGLAELWGGWPIEWGRGWWHQNRHQHPAFFGGRGDDGQTKRKARGQAWLLEPLKALL